ncbi:hypothetical protein ABEW32_20490 [Paenibacillus jamilae]|uniref:hypothetical protein n=1 Tax=Paenibacillus jamilae TaxID=114136 RepID=UPI003D2C2AF3
MLPINIIYVQNPKMGYSIQMVTIDGDEIITFFCTNSNCQLHYYTEDGKKHTIILDKIESKLFEQILDEQMVTSYA